MCENQDEIDLYWAKLGEGGDPKAQQCGWLKDQYGLSWQIVPTVLAELIGDSDPERSDRVMGALLKMQKLEIAGLKKASHG
jgi:predicted 3-demethylubiquinone-9 3-methyltransferase (glyoxalase superfamily)